VAGAALEVELIGALGEVALVQLLTVEIFQCLEILKLLCDVGHAEEEAEGFPNALDTGG
jgi:hypothetical protein